MYLQPSKRLITVDEYYRMAKAGILTEKDRVEFIHGEIIKISPIGSKHAAMVNKISNVLKGLIGDNAIVSVQNSIRIDSLNEPEPDISILKFRDDYYAEKHPSPNDIYLVIEVSDTALNYDREIKLPLYASAGVPEFWLFDLDKNEIEIYRAPAINVYKKIEIFSFGDKISLPTFNLNFDASLLLT